VVLPVLLLRHLLNRHHREPHATVALPLHSDSLAELATARTQYQGRCLHAAVLYVLQLLDCTRSRTQFADPHLALRRSSFRACSGTWLFSTRRLACDTDYVVITGVTLAQRTYLVCPRSIRLLHPDIRLRMPSPSRSLCRCCFIDGFAFNRSPRPLRPLSSSVHAPS
jgi:hypothetical protein